MQQDSLLQQEQDHVQLALQELTQTARLLLFAQHVLLEHFEALLEDQVVQIALQDNLQAQRDQLHVQLVPQDQSQQLELVLVLSVNQEPIQMPDLVQTVQLELIDKILLLQPALLVLLDIDVLLEHPFLLNVPEVVDQLEEQALVLLVQQEMNVQEEVIHLQPVQLDIILLQVMKNVYHVPLILHVHQLVLLLLPVEQESILLVYQQLVWIVLSDMIVQSILLSLVLWDIILL